MKFFFSTLNSFGSMNQQKNSKVSYPKGKEEAVTNYEVICSKNRLFRFLNIILQKMVTLVNSERLQKFYKSRKSFRAPNKFSWSSSERHTSIKIKKKASLKFSKSLKVVWVKRMSKICCWNVKLFTKIDKNS